MQERYDIHSYRTELTAIQNITTGATTLITRSDEEGSRGACEQRYYPPDMNSTMCAQGRGTCACRGTYTCRV